jgi:anti-sigma regulatory factor (Ser/Thr protein kinase)
MSGTRCGASTDAAIGQSASDHWLLVRVLPPGLAAHRARLVVRQVLTDAGVGESDVYDAELAVGELGANADRHTGRPYELRIVMIGGRPVWCEVVDDDPDLGPVAAVFDRLREACTDRTDPSEVPAEGGYGLLMVHRLSGGRCWAFPTIACTTGAVGKAVAFALPIGGCPQ